MLVSFLTQFLLISSVLSHGIDPDLDVDADDLLTYAGEHMSQEHHISDFDLESFFHLHDLDRDGVLSREEIEQIYGLRHETSKGKSKDKGEHEQKIDMIVSKVLKRLDVNGDGVITKREFLSGGMDGLPKFEGVQGLGHHYDAEGEYFLHHEELYHSTPETQTDESYSHPEDIAHFSHHEQIELEEDNLLRIAQGLKPLDANGNEVDAPPAKPPKQEYGHLMGEGEQTVFAGVFKGEEETERQIEKFANARMEANRRGNWKGEGRPKDLADRLRKSVPYKYRVRNSWWGEF